MSQQRWWRQRRARFGAGILGVVMAGFLIPLDQWGNALRGGDPDMTISADCGHELLYLAEPSRFCTAVCWALDFIDPNHCIDAKE